MTGVTLTASLDDTQLRAAVMRLSGLAKHPRPLLRQIGMGLVAAADERFETQTAPDGTLWAPLLPAYAALKEQMRPSSDRILTRSGKLVRSLNYRVNGQEVSYGSAMIYAAIHQFGGTIEPKKCNALVFPLAIGKGGRVFLMHVRSVFIPARPYLGMGPAEVEAVELAVSIQMKKAWRG